MKNVSLSIFKDFPSIDKECAVLNNKKHLYMTDMNSIIKGSLDLESKSFNFDWIVSGNHRIIDVALFEKAASDQDDGNYNSDRNSKSNKYTASSFGTLDEAGNVALWCLDSGVALMSTKKVDNGSPMTITSINGCFLCAGATNSATLILESGKWMKIITNHKILYWAKSHNHQLYVLTEKGIFHGELSTKLQKIVRDCSKNMQHLSNTQLQESVENEVLNISSNRYLDNFNNYIKTMNLDITLQTKIMLSDHPDEAEDGGTKNSTILLYDRVSIILMADGMEPIYLTISDLALRHTSQLEGISLKIKQVVVISARYFMVSLEDHIMSVIEHSNGKVINSYLYNILGRCLLTTYDDHGPIYLWLEKKPLDENSSNNEAIYHCTTIYRSGKYIPIACNHQPADTLLGCDPDIARDMATKQNTSENGIINDTFHDLHRSSPLIDLSTNINIWKPYGFSILVIVEIEVNKVLIGLSGGLVIICTYAMLFQQLCQNNIESIKMDVRNNMDEYSVFKSARHDISEVYISENSVHVLAGTIHGEIYIWRRSTKHLIYKDICGNSPIKWIGGYMGRPSVYIVISEYGDIGIIDLNRNTLKIAVIGRGYSKYKALYWGDSNTFFLAQLEWDDIDLIANGEHQETLHDYEKPIDLGNRAIWHKVSISINRCTDVCTLSINFCKLASVNYSMLSFFHKFIIQQFHIWGISEKADNAIRAHKSASKHPHYKYIYDDIDFYGNAKNINMRTSILVHMNVGILNSKHLFYIDSIFRHDKSIYPDVRDEYEGIYKLAGSTHSFLNLSMSYFIKLWALEPYCEIFGYSSLRIFKKLLINMSDEKLISYINRWKINALNGVEPKKSYIILAKCVEIHPKYFNSIIKGQIAQALVEIIVANDNYADMAEIIILSNLGQWKAYFNINDICMNFLSKYKNDGHRNMRHRIAIKMFSEMDTSDFDLLLNTISIPANHPYARTVLDLITVAIKKNSVMMYKFSELIVKKITTFLDPNNNEVRSRLILSITRILSECISVYRNIYYDEKEEIMIYNFNSPNIYIYDMKTGYKTYVLEGIPKVITGMSLSPRCINLLVFYSLEKKIYFWNLNELNTGGFLSLAKNHPIRTYVIDDISESLMENSNDDPMKVSWENDFKVNLMNEKSNIKISIDLTEVEDE